MIDYLNSCHDNIYKSNNNHWLRIYKITLIYRIQDQKIYLINKINNMYFY